MKLTLNTSSMDDYRTFLRIKQLPRYRVAGHVVEFPDEYAEMVGHRAKRTRERYAPQEFLFDYQAAISTLAIKKKKFACFLQCGLGKTLILTEFARHVAGLGKRVLIVSPLMVVRQTVAEARRFYGDCLPIEQVRSAQLPAWMESGGKIGITNYEAITDAVPRGDIGALILDESSMLKSHYGKWARRLIELGAGLEYKLCLTGTPAPNDRIEYANHAVFLDQFPTVNAFLAKFFVNRGQTDNRWELKRHALKPFYTALSHWSFFMESPATYGWKDNADAIPPIEVHIHDVPLTDEQYALVAQSGGDMFGTPGGIASRAKLSQLAKGKVKAFVCNGEVEHKLVDVPTNKPAFIRDLVRSWDHEESTIVWTVYNAEQDSIESVLPGAASMRGETPDEERCLMIENFQAGRLRTIISKPKVMGFGLNLQIATRQVFSGLVDSFESYWQAVKRSNRIGSTRPLNVHIPITPIERPMVETVLRKAKMVQADAEEQERIFKENACLTF